MTWRLSIIITIILTLPLTAEAEGPLWVSQTAGYRSNGFDIAVDGAGNSYVTGNFKGQISFTSSSMDNPTGRGAKTDVFIASYDPEGNTRWAVQEGGADNDAGLHIATGRTGVYVTGYYKGRADFGDHILPGTDGRCLFVAKYGFDGTFIWARAAGDDGTMGPEGIAVDNNDNVYVFGYFKEYANFGQERLNADMSKNLFIVKYSSTSELQWVRQITGGNSFTTGPWARGMAIAPDGNIMLAITTSGINKFDDFEYTTSETRYGPRHAIENRETVIARYSPSGSFIGMESVGRFTEIQDITTDNNGNIIIAGYFSGMASGDHAGIASFGNTRVNTTASTDDRLSEDIFIAKYNSDYALEWVQTAGGPGTDRGLAVGVDQYGTISLTGMFDAGAKFGETELTVTGGQAYKYDVFLATYSTAGDLLSVEQGGGGGSDRGDGLALSDDGKRYITGFFNGPRARFGNHHLIAGDHSLVFAVGYPPPPRRDWATVSNNDNEGVALDQYPDNDETAQLQEAPSALPVFIGFTEKANSGERACYQIPVLIKDLQEYEQVFGQPQFARFHVATRQAAPYYTLSSDPGVENCVMALSLRHYFLNGGGPCYVISVDNYNRANYPHLSDIERYTSALGTLTQTDEPTLLVAPDIAAMSDVNAYAAIVIAMLTESQRSGYRFAILDVPQRTAPESHEDVLAQFRYGIGEDNLEYGAAYYPWLNTRVVESEDMDYTRFATTTELRALLRHFASMRFGNYIPSDINGLINVLDINDDNPTVIQERDTKLREAFSQYTELLDDLRARYNQLPPSGAVAGIYVSTDMDEGPWQAPANVAVQGVSSVTAEINGSLQSALNADGLSGKPVNAIRKFSGREPTVWGARTLAEHNAPLRFVSVARNTQLIERAIRNWLQGLTTVPNDQATWDYVQETISNYLHDKWREGALKGSTPEDAYYVQVGLGSTMTNNDIEQGRMVVEVGLAIYRPAEFIRLQFVQQTGQTDSADNETSSIGNPTGIIASDHSVSINESPMVEQSFKAFSFTAEPVIRTGCWEDLLPDEHDEPESSIFYGDERFAQPFKPFSFTSEPVIRTGQNDE